MILEFCATNYLSIKESSSTVHLLVTELNKYL